MKKLFVLALFLAVSAAVIITGCAQKTELYGKPLAETHVTSVAALLKDPDAFVGKAVRLEGTIVQECPAGGWVMLRDATGVLFVDMHPTQIAIPQAINHPIAVQGKVKKEYNQVSLVGEGVELK